MTERWLNVLPMFCYPFHFLLLQGLGASVSGLTTYAVTGRVSLRTFATPSQAAETGWLANCRFNDEWLIMPTRLGCIKFGRQSLRNSEPALAGDISIAMGWSSTVRVGVDRKADEAPQSGETPRTNKKYFGTRGMGDRSLGCDDKQQFPVSGLAPFRQR